MIISLKREFLIFLAQGACKQLIKQVMEIVIELKLLICIKQLFSETISYIHFYLISTKLLSPK